ncbi:MULTISPECIES: OpgC domain-containing protein [Bradyrhizobium]|uniref:OpgC domain-containing protein n=1 Tax=Bradyrhizobium TaxID=374 RepID=UPI001FCA937D|nr:MULTISPECIES: OpgC domain-containing protein [Bradyrhizobium]
MVSQTLRDLLFPPDKSNLSPIRLLHFVALAIVALRFIPRNWEGLSTPVLSCAKCCGENSLPIYCFGVLLALASHLALLDLSKGLAMQIVVSVAGVLMMIGIARLLNAMGIRRERKSAGTQSIGQVPPVR